MNKLHNALSQIPDWDVNQIQIEEELKQGPASDSWLVRYLGHLYVLRVDRALAASLPVRREQEIIIRNFVATHGLTPAVVYSDLSQGILLSRYATGRTWSAQDLAEKSQLERLAEKLRTLHKLRPAVAPLDLAGAITDYANTLHTAQAQRWADQAHELLQQVKPRQNVLCHNDLVAQNIVEGEQLWLIDWEYAALGNPLFDLAIVVQHHQLKPAQEAILLDRYFGYVDAQTQFDFQCFCKIYQRVLALYTQVVATR